MKGSTESERALGLAPDPVWWRGFSIPIIFAVIAVFAIALLSAPPSALSRPSHEEGMIWVTAFAAAGTLGAVWAALQAVRISTRETRRIQREAQQRDDTLRHDAIRPVIAIEWGWGNDEIRFQVRNVGTQSALDLVYQIESLDPTMELSKIFAHTTGAVRQIARLGGVILTPYMPDHRETVVQRNAGFPDTTQTLVTNSSVLVLTSRSKSIVPDSQCRIVVRYTDILSTRWQQEANFHPGHLPSPRCIRPILARTQPTLLYQITPLAYHPDPCHLMYVHQTT